jgi:hypothetical protein
LIGFILIPPQAIFYRFLTKEQVSVINGRVILNWRFSFMWPWSNEEDGILAGDELIGWPNTIRIIYWSAIRNPANNLRFVKFLSCLVDPSRVYFVGSREIKDIKGFSFKEPLLYCYDLDMLRFWTFTWCGAYSNLRIQFKMLGKIWRFWIGWKIYPHDKLGISEKDYRYYGAGFATQFKRVYPR